MPDQRSPSLATSSPRPPRVRPGTRLTARGKAARGRSRLRCPGERSPPGLEPDLETAWVVRRIFAKCLAGRGLFAIAEPLTRDRPRPRSSTTRHATRTGTCPAEDTSAAVTGARCGVDPILERLEAAGHVLGTGPGRSR
jgi:hypothetical protein